MMDQMTLYSEHLFDDVDNPNFVKLPDSVRARCLRLRALYTEANAFPFRKDATLVLNHRRKYQGLSQTQAYEDLRIVHAILGNIHAETKAYHLWRYNQMIIDTYNAAVAAGDNNARVKAADSYAKNNSVGVSDEAVIDWSRMPKQPFTITFDPSSLGLKVIPNIREVIDKTYEEFAKNDIADVEFEEVDTNFDPFARRMEDGGATIGIE